MFEDLQAQLRDAVEAILASETPKKVIVAGPGTGKTFLFRQVLERRGANRDDSLILTFINNLKNDIEKELGAHAKVYTFHGFCRSLLHQHASLRVGLTEHFHYYPPIASLIRRDWEIVRQEEAPAFVALMRDATISEDTHFFLSRADYYDSIGFDDSVFRTYIQLLEQQDSIPLLATLLVDEFQDFNRLEAEFIALLATRSPTLIAGDDDQALYSMRSSSPDYIRGLHAGGIFRVFPLPFCLRCTAPIVGAVGDLIRRASASGNLIGRIDKSYLFYPPKKGRDSDRYPRIRLVEVSAQSLRVNYFGRYIQQQLELVPPEDIAESRQGGFPTVLVIGQRQYLRQIQLHLEAHAYPCLRATSEDDPLAVERVDGLRFLRSNLDANIGWRVLMEVDSPPFIDDVVRRSLDHKTPFSSLIPRDYRENIRAEAQGLPDEQEPAEPQPQGEDLRPTIRLTSFEGSKGLSAQHVFIVGLHEGELPRNAQHITDIEICKFLVALTRTRKQCHLLFTWRWGGQRKRPSVFLEWIEAERLEHITVNQAYWR